MQIWRAALFDYQQTNKRMSIKTGHFFAVTGGRSVAAFIQPSELNQHRDNEQLRVKVTQEPAELQDQTRILRQYAHRTLLHAVLSSHWAALICSLKPQYCINSGSSSDNSPFLIPLIMLQITLKQKCNQLSGSCFLYPEHVVYSDTDMLKSSPGALSFYSAFSSKLIWNSWQWAVFQTHQLMLPVWMAEVLTVINCWLFCLSCTFC